MNPSVSTIVNRPHSWTGAIGKSTPMDDGYLPHGTNAPAACPFIQDKILL